MTQYALPNSNVSTTNFVEHAGGDGDGDWFDEMDEGFGAGRGTGSGPNLADGWRSPAKPVFENIRTALSTVTDPGVSNGHIVRSHDSKISSGGITIDLVIRLYESGVERAVSSVFTDIGSPVTTRAHTLTTGEADAITDYSALEADTEVDITGGGPSRDTYASAQEFECPDAPTAGGHPFHAGNINPALRAALVR